MAAITRVVKNTKIYKACNGFDDPPKTIAFLIKLVKSAPPPSDDEFTSHYIRGRTDGTTGDEGTEKDLLAKLEKENVTKYLRIYHC